MHEVGGGDGHHLDPGRDLVAGGWTALLLVPHGLYQCRPGILHLLRCGTSATGEWTTGNGCWWDGTYNCSRVSLVDSSRPETVLELEHGRKHDHEWTAAFQLFPWPAIDGRVRDEQHLHEHDEQQSQYCEYGWQGATGDRVLRRRGQLYLI